MEETAEIRAKIAALQGQINQHKHRPQPYPAPPHHAPNHPYAARGAGRWPTRGRGRGGRAGFHQPVHTHAWSAGDTPTPVKVEPTAVPSADAPRPSPVIKVKNNGDYVQQRGNGKSELMSKETYEREQRQRQEYMQARAQQQDQLNHVAPFSSPFSANKSPVQAKAEQTTRRIQLEGISFEVRSRGSKLIRVSGEYAGERASKTALKAADPSTVQQETPKKATIAGVDFYRTKRGNLMRVAPKTDATRLSKPVPKRQCETFTKQGSCSFGAKCRYAHDPEKVAICKSLLLNGTCPAGDYCDMSHEMSYHRVSACTHFLRGNCTNDACRYPHVNIPASAPVCRAFATLGYCALGEQCTRRHVFECPDHANRGLCIDKNCQLPHYDRAAVMRKAAQRQEKINGESDLSSDGADSDREPNDESDFDDQDAVMTGLDDSHALSQQQDFISF